MPRLVVWIAISIIGVMACSVGRAGEPERDERVGQLAQEVRATGWIAYSARSDNGTWDLFLSRPDGSHIRNITATPDGAALFILGLAKKVLLANTIGQVADAVFNARPRPRSTPGSARPPTPFRSTLISRAISTWPSDWDGCWNLNSPGT